MVVPRRNSPHVKMSGLESCRKWQRTFLYIKNTGSADLINLPAYVAGDPTKLNWTYNPKESHRETNRICEYIEALRRKRCPQSMIPSAHLSPGEFYRSNIGVIRFAR
jgi:hypothetical protein